mgnify:FL=1
MVYRPVVEVGSDRILLAVSKLHCQSLIGCYGAFWWLWLGLNLLVWQYQLTTLNRFCNTTEPVQGELADILKPLLLNIDSRVFLHKLLLLVRRHEMVGYAFHFGNLLLDGLCSDRRTSLTYGSFRFFPSSFYSSSLIIFPALYNSKIIKAK